MTEAPHVVKVPTLAEAQRYLAEAVRRNPGPWEQHALVVAEAARAIATHHPALDAERAYILGLLHDIGRGAGGPGVADVRHLLDGYTLLHENGFEDAARVCLTHSFPAPIKEVDAFASAWRCPAEERQFVQDFLERTEYTPYDRLIQLCDALSLPSGFCLIEKRLVDVALRHGFNAFTLPKWRAYFELQAEFEGAIGTSIYKVLPGVVENTFGWTTSP